MADVQDGGNVFINYRRDDTGQAAGRVGDHLRPALGPDRVFIDIDSIPAGRDFVAILNEQVGRCDVLLAMVGKGWLAAADPQTGARRVDDPDDFVRIEIEAAMERGIRVIPILIDGASMPGPGDLPESLKPFSWLNAWKLGFERFSAEMQGLLHTVEGALKEAEEARAAAPPAPEPGGGTLTPEQIRQAAELGNWEFIKAQDNPALFRHHLEAYAGGVSEPWARARLAETEWQALGEEADAGALQGFVAEFGDSAFGEDARQRLARAGAADPAPNGPPPTADAARAEALRDFADTNPALTHARAARNAAPDVTPPQAAAGPGRTSWWRALPWRGIAGAFASLAIGAFFFEFSLAYWNDAGLVAVLAAATVAMFALCRLTCRAGGLTGVARVVLFWLLACWMASEWIHFYYFFELGVSPPTGVFFGAFLLNLGEVFAAQPHSSGGDWNTISGDARIARRAYAIHPLAFAVAAALGWWFARRAARA